MPRRRDTLPLAVALLSAPSPVKPPPRRPQSYAGPLARTRPAPPSPSPPPPAALLPLFPTPTAELALLHDRVYHLIALTLRAYVQAWYARLSPRDRTFLPAINDLLAPALGSVLQLDRERLVELALLHFPSLLLAHVETYCAAKEAVAAGLETTVEMAYHARMPLRCVARSTLSTADGESEQFTLSPEYLTGLADALLALKLPEKDYASDAERQLVREILGRAVLGSIARKLAAPWFWAQVGLKFVKPREKSEYTVTPWDRVTAIYASILRVCSALWTTGAWLAAVLSEAPPAAHQRVLDPWISLLKALLPSTILFSALFVLIDALGVVLSPIADRLLPHLLMTALSPSLGLKVVDLVERVLYPDGWPVPSTDPTPEQAAELWRQFQNRIEDRLPWRDGADTVSSLQDPGSNAHLIGLLLNAIVATLVPDLVEPHLHTIP